MKSIAHLVSLPAARRLLSTVCRPLPAATDLAPLRAAGYTAAASGRQFGPVTAQGGVKP